jgi:hypothetical protein
LIEREDSCELAFNLIFSKSEEEFFYRKLFDVLKWQAGKYNGIDSTSLPVEKAQELLASLLYTISLVAEFKSLNSQELLERDFKELLVEGQKLLDNKRKNVYSKWNKLCLLAPNIPNVYLVSTIKSLGYFFNHYDLYYAAHEIPCSIDYPLLNPVSEELKGISFIEEYIARVKVESDFINSFPSKLILNELKKVTYDYKEDYLNLCGPILTASIGRKILGYNLDNLSLSNKDLEKISICFMNKSKEEIEDALIETVRLVCKEKLGDENIVRYFSKEISSLAIRIENAVENGSIDNIFMVV